MAARLMVMAGGTGGHVFPALAVARELRDRGWEVVWLGAPDSFEARVVAEQGFPMQEIPVYRLRGQGPSSLLLAPLRLLKAMYRAWRAIRRVRPQVLLGMGGFVAGPGGLVGVLQGLPLLVHEQNAVPGLTNRWLSRWASRTLEAFPGSFPENRQALATGNPVRQEIVALADEDIVAGEPPLHLLVLGGSLGAAALNQTLPRALALLPDRLMPKVRHQAGRDKAAQTRTDYADLRVQAEVSDFIEDMAAAYRWADLVICRAGALTVSELALAGVASVLVPYPHAVDDHQTRNARFLARAGAGILLPAAELGEDVLAGLLRDLLADPGRLHDMARAARRQAQPDATRRVADVCEQEVAG